MKHYLFHFFILWNLHNYVDTIKYDGTSLSKWTDSDPAGSKTIAILMSISINGCINACWNSQTCTYIKYYQRYNHVCVLMSQDDTVTDLSSVMTSLPERSRGSIIYSFKSDWDKDKLVILRETDNTLCPNCQQDTRTVYGCGEIPSVNGTQRLGNMMNVGSKVKYIKHCLVDENQSGTIECQENGEWSQLPDLIFPDNGWLLVFRAVAGNDVDVYSAWVNGTAVTTDVTCGHLENVDCTSHYRNGLVDTWSTHGITKVRFSYYKDGAEVAYVLLDGTGSSQEDWFAANNILYSSWSIDSSTGFNNFSIFGLGNIGRYFYINVNYGGCGSDAGYSLTAYQAYVCEYEQHTTYPQFLYSPSTSYINWDSDDVGYADYMAIFVSKAPLPDTSQNDASPAFTGAT